MIMSTSDVALTAPNQYVEAPNGVSYAYPAREVIPVDNAGVGLSSGTVPHTLAAGRSHQLHDRPAPQPC
jgi:hypothetical protein